MRAQRFLGGTLLMAAVAAACGDTQPIGPRSGDDATPLARAGAACLVSDDAQTRTRTLTGTCFNAAVTAPAGWTVRMADGAAPKRPRAEISPLLTQIENPTPEYVGGTSLIDLSGVADFTTHTSITDGTQTVSFSIAMQKRSVPNSWGTWATPPFVEPGTPHILFTQGPTTLTMNLAVPVTTFGFELGPNPFAFHTFTATYYAGGTQVGTLTREMSGDNGARLMAVQSPTAFDRVVVTGTADFAIARVRYAAGAVQPPVDVNIHAVYSGPPNRTPNQIDLADANVYVEILNIEQYLGRPAQASDIRIGASHGAGVPAQQFTILDINNDGNRDIRLRFSTQALRDGGVLGPNTTQITVWGRDAGDGQMYRGTAQVQIINVPPDPTIDQNQPSAAVYMAAFSQTDLAQSFQTQQSTFPTVGAGIFLQPNVGTTDNVRISLWTALPNQGGTMLTQGQAMGTQGQWVDVIFNTPVLLTPNTTYFLVFDGNTTLGIAGDINNPYPHGHVFANPGFGPFPNFDYTFRTWIAPPGGSSGFSAATLDRLRTSFPSGSVRSSGRAPATRR